MPYAFEIPEPLDGIKRLTPIPIQQLITPELHKDSCSRALKGMFTECDGWAGQDIIKVEQSIYWRGALARSWVLYYLRHYHSISSLFLCKSVGVIDPEAAIETLTSSKYGLKISVKKGHDLDANAECCPCFWYSLEATVDQPNHRA